MASSAAKAASRPASMPVAELRARLAATMPDAVAENRAPGRRRAGAGARSWSALSKSTAPLSMPWAPDWDCSARPEGDGHGHRHARPGAGHPHRRLRAGAVCRCQGRRDRRRPCRLERRGWAGVLEATLAAMEKLGAEAARIAAAIGPCISQANYEVGEDFRDRFWSRATNAALFRARRPGRAITASICPAMWRIG